MMSVPLIVKKGSECFLYYLCKYKAQHNQSVLMNAWY